MTQPAPSFSDRQLVAAVRRGSDAAFEELYSRYRRQIASYVLRAVRDHGRAEDIVQDVFIAALRRLRDTESPIAFKPWVYEIAKNACLDEYRRSGRRREVPFEGEPEPLEGELRAPATPEAAIEHKQRLENLRGAFQGLSESHHRMLVLRELEGRSYQEIGERLGVSQPVVESTLFRARRRLSREYEELVSGRRCEQVQSVIAEGERPLRRLGLRQRRQLARHLAHCQPCRRHARAAGLEEQYFHAPSAKRRLAALLPIPWLRWRRGREGQDGAGASAAHQLAGLVPFQSLAQLADPGAPAVALGRAAAAAAAAVAIGGAGTGLITGVTAGGSHPRAGHAHASVAMQATAGTPLARNSQSAPGAAGSPSVGRGRIAGPGASGSSTKQARQVLTSLLAALNAGLPASDPAKRAVTLAIDDLTGGGSGAVSRNPGAASGGPASGVITTPTTSPGPTPTSTAPPHLGRPLRRVGKRLPTIDTHGTGGAGYSHGSGSSSSNGTGASSGSGAGADGGGTPPGGGSSSAGGASNTGVSGASSGTTSIHAQPQA